MSFGTWLKTFYGRYKLLKVALYLYRQGKPWGDMTHPTLQQMELLEAAALVLYAKDTY